MHSCSAQAFKSFPVWPLTTPEAKWCIKDSTGTIIREGTMKVSDLQNEKYKKPSDCEHLLDIIAGKDDKSDLVKRLLPEQ